MPRATLSATERIKNSKEITTLIHKGEAFFLSPYKVYYLWSQNAKPEVRVAFAVPKKKFGKAVMRNKLKRLSRECFRLNKEQLVELSKEKKKQLNILFLYQKTKALGFKELSKSVNMVVSKIEQQNG